jgi:predicted GNAT family acetyltransferase
MNPLHDDPGARRLSLAFEGGEVWVDYARDGDTLALLRVEADPRLRGSGAAGAFMQAVADFARAEGLKLRPVCDYAATWLKRHADTHDLLA